MKNVLEDSLFVSQNKKFDEIQSIVRQFLAEYVGNSIIKDNIFAVIQNYARKKEIALELLRYPIHDDELWALTFLKQDTIFVCVNTALPLCKQFFAAAHELYHIYCYVENADQSYIKNGVSVGWFGPFWVGLKGPKMSQVKRTTTSTPTYLLLLLYYSCYWC